MFVRIYQQTKQFMDAHCLKNLHKNKSLLSEQLPIKSRFPLNIAAGQMDIPNSMIALLQITIMMHYKSAQTLNVTFKNCNKRTTKNYLS